MDADQALILYWHWLLLGVFLVAADIFVARFSLLWFGLSALVIGGIMLMFPAVPPVYQIVGWILLASILALSWIRYFKPERQNQHAAEVAADAAIGEAGTVIQVSKGGVEGVVEFPAPLLGHEEWRFVSEQAVEPGDRVFIKEVDGERLVVIKL